MEWPKKLSTAIKSSSPYEGEDDLVPKAQNQEWLGG